MYSEQRILYDGSDLSQILGDYRSQSTLFEYAMPKYLYIGSTLPFNNLWVEAKVPNTNPAVVSVEMWWNQVWIPAVDIIDETVGLTQSGRIMFSTEFDKSWMFQDKSERIPELSTTKIYNMYWLRLSWDADFSLLTELNYVGQKYSDDIALFSFYPDLANTQLLVSYKVGKTTWDEQHYMAAEHIERDLKKRGIIKTRNQLLDQRILVDASCHKVAELAYTGFGRAYNDQRNDANKAYISALNLKNFSQDINEDGKLDPLEREISTGFMTR